MARKKKELSRVEFAILSAAYENFEELCGRTLSETETAILGACKEKRWIGAKGITKKGLSALEPYRVKRAIIMAAGFGVRLAPVTLNTPKPLVRIHGKRMIDTLLDAIAAAGIDEVYIIRGYLAEQFDQLKYKYPYVKFVENPEYDKANNIGSFIRVKDLLENAYVMEADLLLKNPALIKKYQYTTNFLGIPVTASEDWCFVVKNGEILTLIPNGNAYAEKLAEGEELYQEVGIVYWNEEAGKKLARHLPEAFDAPDGKGKYWDQVPLVDYKSEYEVEVRPCEFSDVLEIDCFKELVAVDKKYACD